MTCSARLPVYTLIIAAFIPERPLLGPFLGTRAAAMLGLYVLGFLAAFGTARLLKSSVLKSDGAPFLLEMPPYRWPTLRQIGLRLFDRAKIFLRRAGTVILGVAIVLWVLAHLPLSAGQMPAIANSVAGHDRPHGRAAHAAARLQLEDRHRPRHVARGARGHRRHARHDLRHGRRGGHARACRRRCRHDLTPGGAVALLVFFAFAMQCMSTVAVVRRETGGWKWPAIQFAYMGLLAYSGAFVANRIVTLFMG